MNIKQKTAFTPLEPGSCSSLTGFIWDIDGLVVDSPHEEAWRITVMKEPWGAKDLTTDFYFTHVASIPRYEGGNNILKLKGIYEKLGAKTEDQKNKLLDQYCNQKNALIKELIRQDKFKLFPDAIALLFQAKKMNMLQAAASASKNAIPMISRVTKLRIIKEIGDDYGVMNEKDTLDTIFDVQVCGLDLGGKKGIQKYAADKLNELAKGKIKKFVVFEDAPSGIEAAKSLGFYAVGVFRIGQEKALRDAGADIITTDITSLKIEDLIKA